MANVNRWNINNSGLFIDILISTIINNKIIDFKEPSQFIDKLIKNQFNDIHR